MLGSTNVTHNNNKKMKSTKVQNPRRKHAFCVLLYARKVAGVMSRLHAPRSKWHLNVAYPNSNTGLQAEAAGRTSRAVRTG